MKKYIILMIISLFIASCSKTEQELTIPLKNISVKVGDRVILRPESAVSLSFSSENELIASVNEQGQVVGKRKGITFVQVSDGKKTEKIEINVVPKTSYFFEPILVTSVEEFKQKYAQTKGEYIENGYEDFYSRRMYSAYQLNKGTDNAYTIVFYHDTADKEIMIEIPNEKAYSLEDILYWVTERFVPFRQDGDSFEYFSPDRKIGVFSDYDMARGTTQIKIFNIPSN